MPPRNMKGLALALVICSVQVAAQPVEPSSLVTSTWIPEETGVTQSHSEYPERFLDRIQLKKYGQWAHIFARDTTTTSESTSSTTTESTSSETATTSSTTSTSESTTTTSTSTSSASTTSTSSTSSTSTSATSTTSSTTTTTASTTSSTATSTSTMSAEMREWNRAGRNRGIVFGSCLLAFFIGICVIHCARERSKKKRIKQSEELKASASALPYVAPRPGSAADILSDRSSVMFSDGPFSDFYQPRAQATPTPISEHGNDSHGSTRGSDRPGMQQCDAHGQ